MSLASQHTRCSFHCRAALALFTVVLAISYARSELHASDTAASPPDTPAQTASLPDHWSLKHGSELLVENILIVDHPQRERRVIVCAGRDAGVPCDPITCEHRILFLDEAALAKPAGELDRSLILLDAPISPSREITLSAVDLNRDGISEVLCVGGGGAGGTGLLHIFAISPGKAEEIYNGASRFPIVIFRTNSKDAWSIANAGFDHDSDGDHHLVPVEFQISTLQEGRFKPSKVVAAGDFATTLKTLSRRWMPLDKPPHVMLYNERKTDGFFE